MTYTKFHSDWAASDFLSGAAFNHIESQWDEAKADADVHNHDTRYYTKTLSDATFFTTSFYTGFDADLLDGQHYSDLLASVMPIGAIMIWSGTDANVPTGWHICDGGTYGGLASPDLRDRFVIGAGGDYDPGDTAGPATWNGTITPTGTVTVGDHQLTTAELPAHSHGYTEYYSTGQNAAYCSVAPYPPDSRYVLSDSVRTISNATLDSQAVGNGAHGHTGSSVSINIDPRPLYHSLYYIFKYA